MCCIVKIPEKTPYAIVRRAIETMCAFNPDGWGFVNNSGSAFSQLEFDDEENCFGRNVTHFAREGGLVHARKISCGALASAQTHPFRLTDGTQLMMNGDLDISFDARRQSSNGTVRSDTQVAAFLSDSMPRAERCKYMLASGVRWAMWEPPGNISFFGAGWIDGPNGWKVCGNGARAVLDVAMLTIAPKPKQLITYGFSGSVFVP